MTTTRLAIFAIVLALCGCDDDPDKPSTQTEQDFRMGSMDGTVHVLPTGERVLLVYYHYHDGTIAHISCCYLPPTPHVEK